MYKYFVKKHIFRISVLSCVQGEYIFHLYFNVFHCNIAIRICYTYNCSKTIVSKCYIANSF